MTKMRVHELAKKLNISSKELLNVIKSMDIPVGNHMSSLDEDEMRRIEQEMARKERKDSKLPEKASDEKNTQKGTQLKSPSKSHREESPSPRQSSELNKGQKNDPKKSEPRNLKKERHGGQLEGVKTKKEAPKGHPNKDRTARSEQVKSRAHDDKKMERKQPREHKHDEAAQEKKTKADRSQRIEQKKRQEGRKQNTDRQVESKNQRRQKEQSQKRKVQQKKEMQGKSKPKPIELSGSIVVKDLAAKMGVQVAKVMTKLIGLGMMVNQNQEIEQDLAEMIANEFGVEVKIVEDTHTIEAMEAQLDQVDSEESLKERPPVVTVMGHVDHGKTSLLDAIKHSKVTASEAGGITQHIGAYTVNVNGKKVTFLDTPGHEAFTSMRSRGAQITDITILVVAADDGVMPQTIEAISHAKAAKVPIIVAINKMDKPEANADRIKQELLENGLTPEDWGGDTITVPVSARTKEGIDELLDMVLLVAEVEELKANPDRLAVGTIIEAQLDKGKGPVATVLVQKGTLNKGDTVVSGTSSGRIRALYDDKGKQVKKAGPSIPAVIIGLSEVPNAGDTIYATEDEKTARTMAELNRLSQRDIQLKATKKVSLDDLFDQIQEGEVQDLNIIIKGDVRGSIEALAQSLMKLDHEEVKVNIIHQGVGGITEGDVMLASASNALVIGFNVRPNLNAMAMANSEGIDIRTYRVIYEVIEDVQAAIKGMLAPSLVEEVIGRAEVRQTFRLPNGTTIAGIYVQNGYIARRAKVKLLRNDIVVHEGDISSLKRFKDDVREIQTGYEGGLGIDRYNDIKEGDVIEAYVIKEVEREA